MSLPKIINRKNSADLFNDTSVSSLLSFVVANNAKSNMSNSQEILTKSISKSKSTSKS